MWTKSILTIALALGLPSLHSLSKSQPLEQAPSPQESLEEAPHALAWLEGHWIGEGLGGKVEEVWLKPEGGSMLGMFRLISGGKPNFYELVTIDEKAGEFTMRLKHFHANLKGWEEKDKALIWECLELEEGRARFGPVLYELRDKNTMDVWVELGDDNTQKLVFQRQK